MVEDPVRISEEASSEHAIVAHCFWLRQTTVREISSLLASLYDLVDDPISYGRRSVR
jgi:hypothetical protein